LIIFFSLLQPTELLWPILSRTANVSAWPYALRTFGAGRQGRCFYVGYAERGCWGGSVSAEWSTRCSYCWRKLQHRQKWRWLMHVNIHQSAKFSYHNIMTTSISRLKICQQI